MNSKKSQDSLNLEVGGVASKDVASIGEFKWYIVTNDLNLCYMLGSGLLMPPAGFGDKHYQDTFSSFPGWIPVFPNAAPKAAVEFSAVEKKHLNPCIVEIGLDSLRGPVFALDQQGKPKEVGFPDGVDGNEALLLLPAPLPATCIRSVIFESKARKDACTKGAEDFKNVDLSQVSLKMSKTMFGKQASDIAWPPEINGIPARDVPLERPLAVGGILAMLAQIGNTGNLAVDAAKLAFARAGLEQQQHDVKLDKQCSEIISAVGDWLEHEGLGDRYGQTARIYWDLVECMVRARDENEDILPNDAIIRELDKHKGNQKEDVRSTIESLIADLKGISSLSQYTVTELLERHPKPLSRSLLLFFLREDCSAFLELSHDALTECDHVLAAILFGARERWLGLPKRLREMPGLREACCHRMAVLSHKLAGTLVELGSPPARPEPLRELLQERADDKIRQEAELMLARECKWDCVDTTVTLGKGEYKIKVDAQGVNLVLRGWPKSVRTCADHDIVLKNLASESIPAKVEKAVRDMLLKGKPG